MTIRKRLILFLVLVLLSEGIARIAFRSPYVAKKRRPSIPHYQPTINTGWENNPGNYMIDFVDRDNARTVYVNIGLKGERLSLSNTFFQKGNGIFFVGDSWTFGEAVAGEEAFPGFVAKNLTAVEVVNLGVGGHSTLQSLRKLQSLDWNLLNPRWIFYGFLSFHEERNVAENGWVRSLSQSSQSRHATLPYARLSASGGLQFQEMALPQFPVYICKVSALLCLGFHGYWRLEDKNLSKQKELVTKELLAQMSDFVKKRGVPFTVILMDPDSFRYESYLREKSIDFVKVEGNYGRLSYDAHPDLNFHKLAAHRILEKLSATVQK